MRKFTICILTLLAVITAVASLATLNGQPPTPAKKKGASNLDYWLNRATTAPASRPGDKSPTDAANPFSRKNRPLRPDAVPGVIEISDGTQLPGWLYTTRGKPWVVFDPAMERWRQIPFIAVLSITAIVIEENYQLQWIWKGMGEPEKVFTGKKFPYRRFLWEFHLIDGSRVKGTVKGQPLWVRWDNKTTGPMILHERNKGKIDAKLEDVHYVRKVVVSAKMRDAVLKDRKTTAKTRPAK